MSQFTTCPCCFQLVAVITIVDVELPEGYICPSCRKEREEYQDQKKERS